MIHFSSIMKIRKKKQTPIFLRNADRSLRKRGSHIHLNSSMGITSKHKCQIGGSCMIKNRKTLRNGSQQNVFPTQQILRAIHVCLFRFYPLPSASVKFVWRCRLQWTPEPTASPIPESHSNNILISFLKYHYNFSLTKCY